MGAEVRNSVTREARDEARDEGRGGGATLVKMSKYAAVRCASMPAPTCSSLISQSNSRIMCST